MWLNSLLVISEVYKSRTCSVTLTCIMNQQNVVHSEKCAALSVDSDNVIVVICTPFIKPVHQMIVHGGELVFLDSTGNRYRHNYCASRRKRMELLIESVVQLTGCTNIRRVAKILTPVAIAAERWRLLPL